MRSRIVSDPPARAVAPPSARARAWLAGAVCLAACVAAGCGPEKSDTTATAGATTGSTGATTGSTNTTGTTGVATIAPTTTGTTGVELPAECACGEEPGCGEPLCPPVKVSLGCDPPEGVEDLAALQCALEALRDREPGTIAWEHRQDCGYSIHGATISILADGAAVYSPWGGEDLSWSTGPVTLGALRDPDHFTACLAEPDPLDGFACLNSVIGEALVECAPVEW